MAIPLKGKLPWWRKCHPYRFWYLIKKIWKLSSSIKQQLWEDKEAYLILLAGVIIGGLIAIYILFWHGSYKH